MRRKHPWYKDSYGLNTRGFLACLVVGLIALALVISGTTKVTSEWSCDQQAEFYSLPGKSIGGDYRFWSNVCVLTLSDGTKIAAERFRHNEDVAR
jgi:hypothetical protein